jgi:hypothetical protein
VPDVSPDEFRAEIERLGLHRTGEGTNLVEEYELGGGVYLYLPRPETILEHDRREALTILKKTLGIGVRQGVH